MLVYLIFTILVAVLGVVGNLLVLGTLILDRKLRVLNNAFLANLAVADLFIAGVIHPFLAVGILGGKDQSFYHVDQEQITYFCELLASFCVISCSASILSIGSVAINRYVYICHNGSYRKIYSRYTVPVMIAGIWIIGILLDLPNYLGFGDHVFHRRISTCFYDTIHSGYKIFFVILGICFPVLITVYCYIRIVYMVHQSNQRLRESGKNAPTKMRSAIKASDVRLLKTVAAMAILAVVIYTPYTITLLLDRGQIDKRIWWFSNGLMHSFSCLDWVIYAVSNKRIRDGMLAIFSCGRCRNISDQTEVSASLTSGKVLDNIPNTSVTFSGGASSSDELRLEKTNI